MPRYRPVSFIVLFLLLLSSAACMGDDEDDDDDPVTASPTAALTAESVLERARETWTNTESAHFALEVDGDAFLDDDRSLNLRSAEGDIARPDLVETTAKVESPLGAIDISLIAVGSDIYMTNLLSGEWDEAPDDFDYNPSILFSDTDGVGPIMTELQNPELDGTEDVGGVEAHKVTGTVGAERVEEVTAGAIEGESIGVTLWIGVEDAKLLRIVLTEPEGVRESPATWTLLLTEHNKEVTIEPPEV